MLGQIITEAFTVHNVLIMNLGIALGIVIGAMPGLSLTFAVTIVLTLTYGMDSLSGDPDQHAGHFQRGGHRV